MKQVVFERFGDPADVLAVREAAEPTPGPGQVRVRMRFAPVNPSDLLVVRGQYGRLPTLPATPGFEGAGVIDAVGPGWLAKIRGLRPGRRVAVLNGRGGTWQESVVVSAREVVPVSAGVSDEQAASFFVNPATALVLTRHVLRPQAGEWLLQTAAGGALGRMVIRLGKRFGFKTINVVRRRAQAEELLRDGADAVVATDEEPLGERVRALTDGAGVKYALDAVGGATGRGAVEALGAGGRLVVYGTLSGEPIALDPRTLMVGQKSIAGFWLSEWVRTQGPLAMLRLFKQIDRLLCAGVLTTAVGATFGLDEIGAAVGVGRPGKVLLRLG